MSVSRVCSQMDSFYRAAESQLGSVAYGIKGIGSQIGSCGAAVASQVNSCYQGIKNTFFGVARGAVFHATQTAKYVFGQDTTPLLRRKVIQDFVLPAALLTGGAFFIKPLLGVSVLAATVLLVVFVAKKNNLI